MTPQSASDYANTLESMIAAVDPDLVVTVGFRMGDATARSARSHPGIRFAIIDNEYSPGAGCADTVADCYTGGGRPVHGHQPDVRRGPGGVPGRRARRVHDQDRDGGHGRGRRVPPVVRFVTGFENGARAYRPDVVTLHQYIPDFNDPDTGKTVAQGFINAGADVVFGAGGNTGNGGLLAAKEAGVMAIGVDVDQYLTYPEVGKALLTSAAKNVDVAASAAVRDFADGTLEGRGARLYPGERGHRARSVPRLGCARSRRMQGRRDGR